MGFTTTATLTLKSINDFHRVLEFVKPDESDMAPTIKKLPCFSSQFGDHHIQFGTKRFPDWQSVVEYLNNR